MKEKIILGIGLGLLILGVQSRLFGPQPVSRPPAIFSPFIQGLPLDSGSFVVTRVVDGDTIVVTTPGTTEKVRLIGVDTPETVDPRRPVQCFGKEASDFTKTLLNNKSVHLEADPSQDNRDKYGRLLRYVFLGNINVGEKIIAEGYGHEYTYRLPYKYQTAFKNAERLARESKKGLWADGVCGFQNLK